jgi:putative transposase
VFSTKYRKKILTGKSNDDLKQIMFDIANDRDIKIVAMDTDIDHIHLMIDYSPTKSILELVNNFKSISTHKIYKKYKSFLKTRYWKENVLWSGGYFVCSVGEASPEQSKNTLTIRGDGAIMCEWSEFLPLAKAEWVSFLQEYGK